MKYKLIVSKKAEEDIEQAVEWYENKQKGLSKRFMASIKASITTLKENPFAFAVVFMKIRRINTKTFPYSIFYEIIDNEITIFAVIHNSRSEEVWQERI